MEYGPKYYSLHVWIQDFKKVCVCGGGGGDVLEECLLMFSSTSIQVPARGFFVNLNSGQKEIKIL